MNAYRRSFLFLCLVLLGGSLTGQVLPGAVARFSFNNRSDYDEISKRKAALSRVSFTDDRFGNSYSAVYLFGNEYSYINLGTYASLKPRQGSISLWYKIEAPVYAGSGSHVNPLILTKCADRDDFYEAYAIYYLYNAKRIAAGSSRDSIKQSTIYVAEQFKMLTWHHLVLTFNDEKLDFYLNGRHQATLEKGFQTTYNPLDSVMVGASANRKNNRFTNGIVDDIEFYDRVLSKAEVAALYEAPDPNRSKMLLYWVLMVLAVIMVLFIFYRIVRFTINRTLLKEKQRMLQEKTLLEYELRINRALMNPHFIFNSLNTLHNYILNNSQDKASEYLIKFSKLIRRILDSNMSDTISLEMEIELIHAYLQIESMRFKERIDYQVEIEKGIAPAAVTIPIMMVQPFLENAVWHGLLDKKGEKMITISFKTEGQKYIRCTIHDNGTGFKKKSPRALEKKSLAIAFTRQRLELLNRIHGLNAGLDIQYQPEGEGTKVELLLPNLNQKVYATEICYN